ncbi:hypothetical protein ACHAXR_006387 [Thalassiosira sp. AJA248-18]
MVKFGRHVDFFVANELDRQLYVVPYKEVQHKTCIEISKPPHPPPPPAATPILLTPPLQHQSRTPTPQPQPPSSSGLSALFGNTNNNGDLASSPPDITNSPNIKPKNNVENNSSGVKTSAVTLNAGTGAELAAAVKHLLISQRKNPSTAMMIPDDYGFDDPCNENAVVSEKDMEAQKHFFAQRFMMEWRICLKRAATDFDRAMQLFWSEVFDGITSQDRSDNAEEKKQTSHYQEGIRGALPDAALQMYVSAVPPERARETFSFLKDIHSTALINAEALRKLVKKYDKNQNKLGNHSHLLSAKLLPEVYASNFTGSLASLEAGLALLRVFLNMDEDDNASLPDEEHGEEAPKAIRDEKRRLRKLATMDDDLRDVAVLSGGYFGNKKDTDAELVKRRKEELVWLRNMIEGIDPIYIPYLVAHRGFHSIHDRSDVRPLENSLMAYEAAWTNGVHLCECDIALTKDERIILAHDENFYRLGMDPTSPLCNRTVRDLTFKELMNCPLKSGARPPLLFDVLRSAAAIGGEAKMIVEIKAGNTEAGPALARMFLRHPTLMEHVAVVMSFDAFIMHSLRREMAAVFEHLHSAQQQQQRHVVRPTGPHHGDKSAPVWDNAVHESAHPLKAHVLSTIALGSTLSSSPLPHSSMLSNGHSPSHVRLPSMLGGHNRLDSRDMFGLGHQTLDSKADIGLGLNLAEIDMSMSQSSTFLPIPKSQNDLQQQQSHEEKEEKVEEKKDSYPFPPVEANKIKSFPKLLLITVAETPKADYELYVDITKPDKMAELDGWLRGGDGGTLDGVYMQFQKAMMGPEGSKVMRNLASQCDVGIWGANPVPDDWDTFHSLVAECHVSFVNSSLPKHFRRKMKRSMSANTLAMNGILMNHSFDV